MNRKIKKFKKQDSEGPTMFIPSPTPLNSHEDIYVTVVYPDTQRKPVNLPQIHVHLNLQAL